MAYAEKVNSFIRKTITRGSGVLMMQIVVVPNLGHIHITGICLNRFNISRSVHRLYNRTVPDGCA